MQSATQAGVTTAAAAKPAGASSQHLGCARVSVRRCVLACVRACLFDVCGLCVCALHLVCTFVGRCVGGGKAVVAVMVLGTD